MNPGNLRHKITIQKVTTNQDAYGQQTDEGLTDVCTVWADITPLVGKEFFAAETVSSDLTHKIKIRYRPGITSEMRVKFGSRSFFIQVPINYQERNVELQLMCRELV